ncbi:MAG: hypothetical protein KDE51_20770, partial [Anaerolineales bacterium]|nr:hypothetical protein [Anaerolineales bacterium]
AQNPILVDFTTGTRYVAKGDTADLHNNCTLATNPCATVQHAINQASPADSVHVSVGTYNDVFTATISSEVVTQTLLVNKPITVVGGFNSADLFTQFQPITNVVRFAGQGDRVVYVTEGVTATLEGLFISDGFDPIAGGGIYNQGADLTLKGVILERNLATFGGGIYHEDGTLFVNSSVFVENTNISGQNGNGGGIYINNGNVVLENNSFIRNQSNYVSSLMLADVPPIEDAAGYGGAFYQAAGSMTLLNNIFSENGGVDNIDDGNAPTSAYYITPTATVITNGYNIYFANDANLPLQATDIVTDPLFVAPNDYHLQLGSPAVDAGTASVFVGLDVDGQPRQMGVGIDIGADELFQEPDFLFAPELLTATIDSGAVHTYTFTLTNTGDFIDSYTITRDSSTTGGTGWGYDFSPTAVNDLEVGQAVTVSFVITGGSPGYVDTTNLTAASVADPSRTKTVTATTRITQIAGVLFEPSRAGETIPNSPIVYTHTLTNTGNGPDSYELAVSSQTAAWDVAISPMSTAVLLPNESITVTVTITPPVDALAGVVHQAEITAVSVADAAVSDTVTDTTTILPVLGLLIDPAAASYTVADGQTAVYTHTLISQSNVTDTISISVATDLGPDWTVGPSTPTVELAPFGTAEISVSVDVPPGSTGLVHTMNVTATSTLSPSVQATAVNTTTVQTIRDVTLVPDNASSTTAGQTAVYQHTLTNSGNATDSFTLSATSSEGWSVTVDPLNSGSLAANQSIPVTVSVTVPAGAVVGTVDLTMITATSTNAVTVTASVTDTTTVISETVPTLGVVIAPDNHTETLAGQTIFYYHTVTNTGSLPATIDLDAVSSEGWFVTLNPTSVNLNSAETAEVEVSLVVPAAATVGTVDTMVVTATNTADASVFDMAVNTTTITDTAVAQLTLRPATNAQDGGQGQLLTYSHTLVNEGNQADSVTLAVVSDNGWTVTVNPTSVPLAAGQQTAVQVTVQIPADAVIGTLDRTTVTATSGNDDTQQATAVNTTTVVETPSGAIYLPAIFSIADSGNPTPTPTSTPTTVTPTPTATPVTHIPTCIQPAYGTVNGVDLVVESAQILTNNPSVGQLVDVAVTIRNQGDTAVAFGNNFYLDV